MLLNYMKSAWRSMFKNKLFTVINILGLAIAATASILIILYIHYELSYENFQINRDRIYRVLTIDSAIGTNNQRVGVTMPALGLSIAEHFPEIEAATRITGGRKMLIQKDKDKGIYAENVRAADANFLSFFNTVLISGNTDTALIEPYSIVLNETLSKAIFGSSESLGASLKLGAMDVTVTGIMKNLPANSHFSYDAIISISTYETLARANHPEDAAEPIWLERWHLIAIPTYLMLNENASSEGLEERITEFIRENDVKENFSITIQPLNDVHLNSSDIIFDNISNKGDIDNVHIFGLIAILIIVIAAVNYMNLSTSGSILRAREIGIRKAMGSQISQLRIQFLGESLLITLISLLISIPLLEISLPGLNIIAQTDISLNGGELIIVIELMVAILVIFGILSGLYPAFVLSKYKAIKVLSCSFNSQRKGIILRRLLVVMQFTLSISLIALTFVVKKQIDFLSSKDIGFNREQVVYFEVMDGSMYENLTNFTSSLRDFSGFISVGSSNNIPVRTFSRTNVLPEGVSKEEIWYWNTFTSSGEFIETLEMQLVSGRNFYTDNLESNRGTVIINQTAAQQSGWKDPIGKIIYAGADDEEGVEVVGVVKDFNFITMNQNIEPVIIYPLIDFPGSIIAARIEKERIAESLDYAKLKWEEFYPQYPFLFTFLDERFDELYNREKITSIIVRTFSMLAIFISCLGLLGLSIHTINQRTKEIGIRKVLGASSFSITLNLAYDFLKWVLVAFLMSIPICWYFAENWLNNFAYRINLELSIFIEAGLFAISIAIAAVLFQIIHAANANPINSLKYE